MLLMMFGICVCSSSAPATLEPFESVFRVSSACLHSTTDAWTHSLLLLQQTPFQKVNRYFVTIAQLKSFQSAYN